MAELVLRKFARALGVVVIAFDLPSFQAEADRIAHDLGDLGDLVADAVIVLEPGRVRRRPFDISQ